MLRKIFSKSIDSITVAAALVAISSLASRVLGVVRDRILAGSFGAGSTLDTYFAAFRIPDLIFNLVILGALSAGFIPIFTALIRRHRDGKEGGVEKGDEAWLLVSNVLNFLLIGIASVSYTHL